MASGVRGGQCGHALAQDDGAGTSRVQAPGEGLTLRAHCFHQPLLNSGKESRGLADRPCRLPALSLLWGTCTCFLWTECHGGGYQCMGKGGRKPLVGEALAVGHTSCQSAPGMAVTSSIALRHGLYYCLSTTNPFPGRLIRLRLLTTARATCACALSDPLYAACCPYTHRFLHGLRPPSFQEIPPAVSNL